LHCPAKALQNDDLWLEITTDGDESPSIAAPVRYFFPGLDGGKNYQNFVVLNRDGFVNRLAMPYTQRIAFAVVNHGRRAMKDLGLTVAYDDSYRVEKGSRSTLRGVYLRSTQPMAVEFPIPVRLVGIVCSERPGQPDGEIQTSTDPVDPYGVGRGELLGLPPDVKEVRQTLNGRSGGLAWRWWLLGPPALSAFIEEPRTPGDRLIFYYAPRGAMPVPIPE